MEKIDNEVQFRLIIEQAPVAIATFSGPDFIIELFNDKVLEYWGRTAEQVKGMPVFTALPEARGQGFEELLTKVLITGERFVANEMPVTLLRHGKLDTTFINFIYDPLRDENGDITGIIVVCNDVTEQVNARKYLEHIIEEKTKLENTLRTGEQRLQSILDTMAEGVGIIDASGQIVYANPRAQEILGLPESQIKERTYDDPRWNNSRLDGSPLPKEEHPMTIMMHTGKPLYDCEIGIQPSGKEVLYISINAVPLKDHQGNLIGGVGTFMDVTKRHKLSQQKDEFISVASHELKTPLTSLKAAIQLLDDLKEEMIAGPFIPTLIEEANRGVKRLNNLVNNLLDVNRILREQFSLKKTTFSIVELIKECCEYIQRAGTKEVSLQGDIDITICADKQRIDQVIVNFVSNAVKYAPQSKLISIAVEKLDSKIKVSVTDSGPGIPKERVPYLFNRYYRSDDTIGQGAGLGLGLYLSSEIIKSHNGEIGVDSEPGKGSTFWFTLPITDDCD